MTIQRAEFVAVPGTCGRGWRWGAFEIVMFGMGRYRLFHVTASPTAVVAAVIPARLELGEFRTLTAAADRAADVRALMS